jgi:tetratricopeptide (TPR) repeat protein
MAMAFCCHLARNYDEALLNYKLARDLDETFCPAHVGLALLFADQEFADRSVEAAERAIELRPHDPLTLAIGAYANSRAGRTEQARQCREHLLKQCETQYVPPVARAIASVSAGEVEAALDELELALEERSAWLACVPLLRAFEPLHGSGRYEEVVATLRLPHRIAVVA